MNKFRMAFSLPNSRNTSRSSSSTSINTLDGDDIIFGDDRPKKNASSSEAAQEIHENMPTDTSEMPDFKKSFTMSHPLGNLILRLSATNQDLCRKLNIEPQDCPDLSEVCNKFVDAIKIERDRTKTKFNKATNDIEDSILEKEMNFHMVNSQVQPPKYFSPIPVLVTASKLQDAVKTFPTRSGQRFTGTQGGVNIVEFLHSLNTAQSILNLSKKEFMEILLKCVSGRVYNLVSECLSYEHDVADLYHALLTLYDQRMTSHTARKVIMNYRALKSSNLMKVQSQIMEYASRIASQLPQGPRRTAMFNIESGNALVRALPPTSAATVTNVMNSLASKLQRLPTFVELTKALGKYADTINQDIQKNGAISNKNLYSSQHENSQKSPYKVYSLEGNRSNRQNTQTHRNVRARRNTNFNPRNNNYGPRNSRNDRNFVRGMRINAINSNDDRNGRNGPNRSFQPNRNRSFGQFRGKSTQNNDGFFKGRYCSLCGSKSHFAKDGCLKMRDENNRLIEVIPTFYHCEICYEKLGKKLYHPVKNCFNKNTQKEATD